MDSQYQLEKENDNQPGSETQNGSIVLEIPIDMVHNHYQKIVSDLILDRNMNAIENESYHLQNSEQIANDEVSISENSSSLIEVSVSNDQQLKNKSNEDDLRNKIEDVQKVVTFPKLKVVVEQEFDFNKVDENENSHNLEINKDLQTSYKETIEEDNIVIDNIATEPNDNSRNNTHTEDENETSKEKPENEVRIISGDIHEDDIFESAAETLDKYLHIEQTKDKDHLDSENSNNFNSSKLLEQREENSDKRIKDSQNENTILSSNKEEDENYEDCNEAPPHQPNTQKQPSFLKLDSIVNNKTSFSYFLDPKTKNEQFNKVYKEHFDTIYGSFRFDRNKDSIFVTCTNKSLPIEYSINSSFDRNPISVTRKFCDFKKFHNFLLINFSYLAIPILPSIENTQYIDADEKEILQSSIDLEEYLVRINNIAEIKEAIEFQAFLLQEENWESFINIENNDNSSLHSLSVYESLDVDKIWNQRSPSIKAFIPFKLRIDHQNQFMKKISQLFEALTRTIKSIKSENLSCLETSIKALEISPENPLENQEPSIHLQFSSLLNIMLNDFRATLDCCKFAIIRIEIECRNMSKSKGSSIFSDNYTSKICLSKVIGEYETIVSKKDICIQKLSKHLDEILESNNEAIKKCFQILTGPLMAELMLC